jgi:hypothetical protein
VSKILDTNRDTLLVFGDVHGDFAVLVEMLTNVAKVAREVNGRWQWTAENTTVVCLGDFVDRFRIPQPKSLTTKEAIADEVKILACLSSLEAQAGSENNSRLVMLVGNHEVANILDIPEYRRTQVAHPDSGYERGLRRAFVKQHLAPFCLKCGVVAKWANYYLCHASLESGWLARHQFQAIPEINEQFRKALRQGLRHRMAVFLEPDSLLVSRKMALHPTLWREQDKLDVAFVLGRELVPKFVSGHTTVQSIEADGVDFDKPRCINAECTSILSGRDYNNIDDMFFLDVAMSDGFTEPGSDAAQRFACRPQALTIVVHSDRHGMLLYDECATVALSEKQFQAFEAQPGEEAPSRKAKAAAPEQGFLQEYDPTVHTKLQGVGLFLTTTHRGERSLFMVSVPGDVAASAVWTLLFADLSPLDRDLLAVMSGVYFEVVGKDMPVLSNIRRMVWKNTDLIFMADAPFYQVPSGLPAPPFRKQILQVQPVPLNLLGTQNYPLHPQDEDLIDQLRQKDLARQLARSRQQLM